MAAAILLRFTSNNREDICLQTLLLLFNCANHWNERPFVSTANEALVDTLINPVLYSVIVAMMQCLGITQKDRQTDRIA